MVTSILIVEDEALVAAELKQRLADLGYAVIGTAGSVDEAVERTIDLQPNLVLMDIGLREGGDGIEAAKVIHSKVDVAMVYGTAHSDLETLERAKVTEPGGYVVKPYKDGELRAAIEMALHRHAKEQQRRRMAETVVEALTYLDEPIFKADDDGNLTFMNAPARKLLKKTGTPLDRTSILNMLSNGANTGPQIMKGMDSLSRREQEILGWFLRGYGTSTIGTELNVSPQTVRNHLKNVCRKLAVRTQVELRELFAEAG